MSTFDRHLTLNSTVEVVEEAVEKLTELGFNGFLLDEDAICIGVWDDYEFTTGLNHEWGEKGNIGTFTNLEDFINAVKKEFIPLEVNLTQQEEKELKILLDQFENMTLALAKNGQDIKQEMTPEQANLLHMGVGISGEAGELLDAIKKHTIYQKPLDVENVKEELGDLLFYMSNLMQSVGLSFEEVLQHNVDKLSVRYSSGKYSNKQAQERADKV